MRLGALKPMHTTKISAETLREDGGFVASTWRAGELVPAQSRAMASWQEASEAGTNLGEELVEDPGQLVVLP